jgi:hypothetical protein
MGGLILFLGATVVYAAVASSNDDPADSGTFGVMAFLCLLIGAPLVRSAMRRCEYNTSQFPIDVQAWDKKFICMRCSAVFVVD